MVKTCNCCRGHSGDYDEAKLRRCAGCQKVYYCSTSCQKEDWVYHIFHCKPSRPINTADYLARAVFENLLPEHPQTCDDYGFSRVFTAEEKSKLLGLYIGLIKVIKIPPKTIHGWRIRGALVDEIKATFYKIPERTRGGYFPWFLQNEHIIALAGQPLSEDMMHNYADEMMRSWPLSIANLARKKIVIFCMPFSYPSGAHTRISTSGLTSDSHRADHRKKNRYCVLNTSD
ncbi:hypothetical protein JVT61DRAFT_1332 [Boletus reticuloceps]|uniref:MYND-type domain-containing protein n=1 Tax=Boletus reticuloceps TaxID=495285 RepID=A0A8I3ABG5_9AGAM|nr:hypothetical protein JVT61DRAFT_1332 [Boletus reticuloceps]